MSTSEDAATLGQVEQVGSTGYVSPLSNAFGRDFLYRSGYKQFPPDVADTAGSDSPSDLRDSFLMAKQELTDLIEMKQGEDGIKNAMLEDVSNLFAREIAKPTLIEKIMQVELSAILSMVVLHIALPILHEIYPQGIGPDQFWTLAAAYTATTSATLIYGSRRNFQKSRDKWLKDYQQLRDNVLYANQ